MLLRVNSEGKKMDKDDVTKKIKEDEDFIRCPKCDNSLTKFLMKNSEGVEDSVIAKLLMISEEKVKELYEDAISKLRKQMGKN